MPRLTHAFYRRDAITVAQALLGQQLVRVMEDGTRLVGRIVETEAYLGIEDAAAHTYQGRRTARVASMYLAGGHAYVYFTYGMHWCMNIVAGEVDVPVACLLRALEPVEGVEVMRAHRAGKAAKVLKDTQLCSGPAKLAQALKIDQRFNGVDLVTHDQLFVEAGPAVPAKEIIAAPRVGVAYAGAWAAKPLRFYVRGNPHVSRP